MAQAQLSFDTLFNQIFVPDLVVEPQIKVGDKVSVMNKTTFEHSFDVVLYVDDESITTKWSAATDDPRNHTHLKNLVKIAGVDCCYENNEYAIAKLDKFEVAMWREVGLGEAFSQQLNKKRYIEMHIARNARARKNKING